MDFINIKNEKSFDKYAIELFNYHFKKTTKILLFVLLSRQYFFVGAT